MAAEFIPHSEVGNGAYLADILNAKILMLMCSPQIFLRIITEQELGN